MKTQLLTPLRDDWKLEKLPQHIAIIMDGNGRWASRRGLPRIIGHRQGAQTLKTILRCCKEWGIKTLTVYAFSTENWGRPQEEVRFLMGLFEELLNQELLAMQEEGIQLQLLGDLSILPSSLQEIIEKARVQTQKNRDICLNIAINYGSRQEITKACQILASQVQKGLLEPETITPQLLENYLDTRGIGEPDLLIRTSGEMRLSNFLLWQIAYTEIYVTDTLWPDFTAAEFYQALLAYQQRDRRFGRL